MNAIQENLRDIRAAIAESAMASGRPADAVQLVAVSKTFPASAVREAMAAGQGVFAESRAQELSEKAAEIDAEWHFIGHLQRNKVRPVVASAALIHSVDSESLLRRIDRIAGEFGKTQALLLQANISGEASKSGFSLAELGAALDLALSLPQVSCQGFMTMAPYSAGSAEIQALFCELRNFRDSSVARTGAVLPVLSMGMSSDFREAIAAGATHVRIGRAIFGERGC
jgi:pyridoxal phosphate enzyme (YggS family)